MAQITATTAAQSRDMAAQYAATTAAQSRDMAAQYAAEAVAVAAELRTFRPHSDPGTFLALSGRLAELRRWVGILEGYGAAA
jgi:hypothetical protein